MSKKIWFLALLLLLTGVVVGMLAQRYGADRSMSSSEKINTADRKVLFYRHPMNHSITSDKPLKDEMGMDYIPVYAGGESLSDTSTVTISPQMVHNMGVRTARVERGALKRIIDTVGYVGVDENKIRRVQVRTEGWVERLTVNFVGEHVHKGGLLFEVYAPKLVSAQQEYVAMLALDNTALQAAARQRIAALGVGEAQIAALEKTRRVPRLTGIYAQQDGVVQSLNIRPGAYVEPATETMTLADLSSVWVLADVFGQDVARVQPGAEAEARFAAIPGKIWHGSVDYIYPGIDSVTRTLKVRLRFDNPDALLKPNMYASVRIDTGAPHESLSIPREALIRTDTDSRVIVALGEGRFAPRTVEAGGEFGERIEILSGLEEGEQVVTSGQFLLDSESNLRAGLQRLSAPDAEKKQEKIAQGRGIIESIQDGKITISHEPIAAMSWPTMTMDFRLPGGTAAISLKPGAPIEFEFHEEDGDFVISKITPLRGETQ